MKFTILTLFPEMFEGFLSESIVKRAIRKDLVDIEIIDVRDFAVDKHGTVDDRPYGGGAGMVMMVEPIIEALKKVQMTSSNSQINYNPQVANNKKFSNFTAGRRSQISNYTILTSPRGTVYTQEKAQEYAKLDHVIIIAGHYEGVDERVLDHVDEEVSIGDYVLTGGELPAAVIVDSIVRLLPGVLKKTESTETESFFTVSVDELMSVLGEDKLLRDLKKGKVKVVRLLEYPQYTRPHKFGNKEVPDVLLSGNHKKIHEWQLKQAYKLTKKNRPDLLRKS